MLCWFNVNCHCDCHLASILKSLLAIYFFDFRHWIITGRKTIMARFDGNIFFNANETLEMKIELFSYAHCKIKLPNNDIDLMFFCTFFHLVFGINPLLSMIRWSYLSVVFSQTHTALKKVVQCFFFVRFTFCLLSFVYPTTHSI